jgi:hypothetical protein
MAIEGQVGICTECKTTQRDSYLIRKGFGFDAPCQFCGGVIASVPAHLTKDKETMDQIKDQMDLERGIGTTVHPE